MSGTDPLTEARELIASARDYKTAWAYTKPDKQMVNRKESAVDDNKKLALIESQALAASDTFDVGATDDPDVILAGNAKAHILWLVEQLGARDLKITELTATVDEAISVLTATLPEVTSTSSSSRRSTSQPQEATPPSADQIQVAVDLLESAGFEVLAPPAPHDYEEIRPGVLSCVNCGITWKPTQRPPSTPCTVQYEDQS